MSRFSRHIPAFYWLPDALLVAATGLLRLPINPQIANPSIEAPIAIWVAFTLMAALTSIFRPSLRFLSRWCGLLSGVFYLGALESYGMYLEFPLGVAYMIVQIFLPRIPPAMQREEIKDVPKQVTVTSNISSVNTKALTANDLWRQSLYTKEKFAQQWSIQLPRLGFPPVTLILLGLNIALFWLAWRDVPPGILLSETPITLEQFPLADSSASLSSPSEWPHLLSSMFFHWSVVHLVSNMLLLFWLGRVIEPVLGSVRFAVYYLIGGLFASVMGVLDLEPTQLGAGASGAVFALIGIYITFFIVHYRVLNVDGKERWAAMFLMLSYMLFTTLVTLPYGVVGHAAHMGGLVAGVLLLLVGGPYYVAVPDTQNTERLRLYKRNLLTLLLSR